MAIFLISRRCGRVNFGGRLVNATFAIAATSMPRADSNTICARRQVTTDPLPRRSIRTSRRPSSSSISRTRRRSVTGLVSAISTRSERTPLRQGRIGVVSRSLLVVVSGLPGAGKTTLSTALAERIGAVALSRDMARQQIGARLAPVDRAFARLTGRHRRGLQKKAELRLEMAVARELAASRPVVVEVVADRAIRRRLAALAANYQVPIYSIEVVCPDAAELSRRLHGRPGNWQQILARTSKSYEPEPRALILDSRNTPGTMADQATQFIRHHPEDEP